MHPCFALTGSPLPRTQLYARESIFSTKMTLSSAIFRRYCGSLSSGDYRERGWRSGYSCSVLASAVFPPNWPGAPFSTAFRVDFLQFDSHFVHFEARAEGAFSNPKAGGKTTLQNWGGCANEKIDPALVLSRKTSNRDKGGILLLQKQTKLRPAAPTWPDAQEGSSVVSSFSVFVAGNALRALRINFLPPKMTPRLETFWDCYQGGGI